MELHILSFGTVTLLRPDMAEIIVSEGVEMDMVMVEEYHDFVSEHLTDPCGILINKKNRYSYTFDAQATLSTLKQIKAIAILVYSDAARIATETLMKLPTPSPRTMKIFADREAGMKWLEEQLAK